jgi:hypothetical protein
VELWHGRDPRKCILTIDCGGAEGKPGRIFLVTAPWLKPLACVRCRKPTLCRFHVYGSDPPQMVPAHAECTKVTLAELVNAA